MRRQRHTGVYNIFEVSVSNTHQIFDQIYEVRLNIEPKLVQLLATHIQKSGM